LANTAVEGLVNVISNKTNIVRVEPIELPTTSVLGVRMTSGAFSIVAPTEKVKKPFHPIGPLMVEHHSVNADKLSDGVVVYLRSLLAAFNRTQQIL